MADLRSFKPFIKALVSPIFFNIFYGLARRSKNLKYRSILSNNRTLRNLHHGKRCFILGNAPSLKNHDLKRLAGEVVFTVSNGYLHPEFSFFKPAYHCVPQLTFSNLQTEAMAIEWFLEMDHSIGSADIFLHLNQKQLVEKNKLFYNRNLWWINTHYQENYDKIDLCRAINPIQSAPQMAISIALYMGFSEIYLLGVDHDFLCSGKYDYFYDRDKQKHCLDPAVDEKGKVKFPFLEGLEIAFNLFKGYEVLDKSARAQKSKIVNLSEISMLRNIFESSTLKNIVLNKD